METESRFICSVKSRQCGGCLDPRSIFKPSHCSSHRAREEPGARHVLQKETGGIATLMEKAVVKIQEHLSAEVGISVYTAFQQTMRSQDLSAYRRSSLMTHSSHIADSRDKMMWMRISPRSQELVGNCVRKRVMKYIGDSFVWTHNIHLYATKFAIIHVLQYSKPSIEHEPSVPA